MNYDPKILFCLPGQLSTVVLTTFDGYGNRADGYSIVDGYDILPYITRVVFPDLSLSTGFPQNMIKLDVGLYYYQFTLPTGAAAAGSYLIDITYLDPGSGLYLKILYQLLCCPIFGQYGASIPVAVPSGYPYCFGCNSQ
jgi:hypothetical protein